MAPNSQYKIITITGHTACGKTKLAAHLCYHINGEIISADSRQVYKFLNIGTGKDYEDYFVNNVKINYHLIDICYPGEQYNVFKFKKDFFNALLEINSKNKKAVLCGGTGLYIEAVLRNYPLIEVPPNQELRSKLAALSLNELIDLLKQYNKTHNISEILKKQNKERAIKLIEIAEYYKKNNVINDNYPPIESINFVLFLPPEERRKKIKERLINRINNGLIAEVEELIKLGISKETLLNYGLEYKYVTLYLSGELTYDVFFEKLYTAICQFAKRQMTYFRGMEKRGIKLIWINAIEGFDKNLNYILELSKNFLQ